MQKNLLITGVALALTLVGGTVSSAQQAERPDRSRSAQSNNGAVRGPGNREKFVLRGITLSADQKARIAALDAQQKKQFDAERAKRDSGRNGQARVRGDTTGRAARLAEMQQRREQHFAAIRAILDNSQRTQFDKNVTELKSRTAQGGEKRGKGQGRHGKRAGE